MTPQSRVVRDELAKLRGRHLGSCASCGRTVFFEQNFMRMQGRVVHVRCPLGAVVPAPGPAPAGAVGPVTRAPTRPLSAR